MRGWKQLVKGELGLRPSRKTIALEMNESMIYVLRNLFLRYAGLCLLK